MPRPDLGKECSLWFCTYKHYALGWCSKHYQNQRKHGQLTTPGQEDLRRALRMVDLMAISLREFVAVDPYMFVDADQNMVCRYCKYLPDDGHSKFCTLSEAEHILANF